MAHINMARIKAKTALAAAALLCHLSFMACQPNSASSSGDDDTKLPAEDLEQPIGVGDGTAQKPYTVGQVLAGTDKTTDVWVAGYVVGYAVNTINKSYFSATGAGTDNVLLAATPDETGINRILTVQLSGKSVQQGVSLAYNPKNLKQAVMLHTALISRYLYAPGLREVDACLWLTNPEGLDLNSGWKDAEETEEPEEPGGASEPSEPSEPQQPEEPATPDNPTDSHDTDVYNIYGITDWPEIEGVNNKMGNSSERFPSYPDFIMKNPELLGAYIDSPGWIIGYAVKWYDDKQNSVVIASSPDGELTPKNYFVLDLKDEKALEWMLRTYTDTKVGTQIRIEGKLKHNSNPQRYHIKDVETMQWVYFPN